MMNDWKKRPARSRSGFHNQTRKSSKGEPTWLALSRLGLGFSTRAQVDDWMLDLIVLRSVEVVGSDSGLFADQFLSTSRGSSGG